MVTLWIFHSLVFCDSVEGSSLNFSRVVLPYGLTRLPSTDLNWKNPFSKTKLFLQHASSTSCSFHSTVLQVLLYSALRFWDEMHTEVRNYTPSSDCCPVFSAHHHITLLHKHSHADLIKNTIVREISFEHLFISFWNFLHLKNVT